MSPAPVLQGAWANKSTPNTHESSPPPQHETVSQTPPPRKSSWANIAKDPSKEEALVVKEETEESLNTTVTTAEVDKPEESKNISAELSKNAVAAVTEVVKEIPSEVETISKCEEGEVLQEISVPDVKTDSESLEESIKEGVKEVVVQEEPIDSIVIKEEDNQSVIAGDVVMADTNGNFPTDANENITVISKEILDDNKEVVEEGKILKEDKGILEEKQARLEEELDVLQEKMDILEGKVEVKVEVKLEMKEEVKEEVKKDDTASEINRNVSIVKVKDSDSGAPMTNGIDSKETKEEVGLPYTANQWSPVNPDGKKQYERDFLLQLQKNPLSLQKPAAMPANMEIILPEPDLLRHVSSAPNLGDFTPQYITGRASNRGPGTPNRRDSRQGNKSNAAARLGVKVINLTREEVKLNTAENAWKPTVKETVKETGAEGEQTEEQKVEALAKQVRSILNKLCPQKFDTLVQQFRELQIDSQAKLTKSMELVFEKALDEPVFSVAYARMCQALSMKKVVAEAGGKEINFRTLLITRCQKEFQRDYTEDLDREAYRANLAKATTDDERKLVTAEFEAQETKLRRRSLGNIRFIGELYRISMLNGRIMHECIQKLLGCTDEESLECMCRLITTVGQQLDLETQKLLGTGKPGHGFASLDIYFTNIRKLIDSKVSTSRIRFLMQDVIDLRNAGWVARREVAGPKTIQQIHEDVAREALKKNLENSEQGPPPNRRSEDRGERRRSQMKPPPKEKQQSQDGWSNVADRPARMSQGKIDTNKLRNISKVDINSMQLGPSSGSRSVGFSSWGRGSAQGGSQQKKASMQVQPANRFALFNDEDEATIPAQPQHQYHGRASEPAIRTYGGRNSSGENSHSRESSQSKDFGEGSYTGRHSNREAGHRNRESVTQTVVPEAEPVCNLKGNKDTAREVLEQKTHAFLDEFVSVGDLSEAYQCVTELYHPDTVDQFMDILFDHVLEKSSKDRVAAGRLLTHLLSHDSLPQSVFLRGVVTLLEMAEDIAIDIPKFWPYIAEIISQPLLVEAAKITLISEAVQVLPDHLVEKFLASLLEKMVSEDGEKMKALWTKSGLSLNELKISNPEQFCRSYNISTLLPVSNGLVDSSMYGLSALLASVAATEESNPSFNGIFDYISQNFKDTTDSSFIRNLMSSVIQASLVGLDSDRVNLDPNKLTKLGGVLKPYLDAQKDREVQALYSLQALIHKLEHPNKLLHSIFDVLYEIEIISEDSFLEWEESTEVGEQEGKGVALKSCTQFFQWLKTAEAEDEMEDSSPEKVVFSIGDDKETTAGETN